MISVLIQGSNKTMCMFHKIRILTGTEVTLVL